MEIEKPSFWKKCSNCKKEIPFKAVYQACSVSTCNHARRGLYFCSVSCWSAHVPLLRHREAYALEKIAPSYEEYAASEGDSNMSEGPKKILVSSTPAKVAAVGQTAGQTMGLAPADREVLIVVSKLKDYIRTRSEMNTSGDVSDWLSDRLRALCDEAIGNARADGRKTVMARDFR